MIGSNPSIETKVYNGVGEYSFGFLSYSESSVSAYHTDDSGVVVYLQYGTDYTVSLNDLPLNGGFVDITTEDIEGGSITLYRSEPYENQEDLKNAGPYNLEVIERSFDRCVMMIQQLDADITSGMTSFLWGGEWVSGILYKAGTLVYDGTGNLYICVQQHTSGTFSTDLTNGLWHLILDYVAVSAMVEQAGAYADSAKQSEEKADSYSNSAMQSVATASALLAAMTDCRDQFLTSITDIETHVEEMEQTVFEYSVDVASIAGEVDSNRDLAQIAAGQAWTKADEASASASKASDYADQAASAASLDMTRKALRMIEDSTIVAVKIYMPYKDKTGWASKSRGTSWYKELGPIPSLVGIVLTETSMYIFDMSQKLGTVPVLWFQVNGSASADSAGYRLWPSGRSASSLDVSEGVIAFGTTYSSSTGSTGICVLDFVNDRYYRIAGSGVWGGYSDFITSIADDELFTKQGSGLGIASNIVNCVAMVLLPGHSKPTIAVGTTAGISVIDGTAGEGTITRDAIAAEIASVKFINSGRSIVAGRTNASIYFFQDFSTDNFAITNYFSGDVTPRTIDDTVLDVTQDAVVYSSGVSLLRYNEIEPTNTLVNNLTSEGQSGWFNANTVLDISGDTTEETVGTDLSPIFEDDFGGDGEYGWTLGTDWSVSNGTLYHADTAWSVADNVKMTLNQFYEIVLHCNITGINSFVYYHGANTYYTSIAAGFNGIHNDVFKCVGTSIPFRFGVNKAAEIYSSFVIPVNQFLTDPYFDNGITEWTDSSQGDTTLTYDTTNKQMVFTGFGNAYTSIADIDLNSLIVGKKYKIRVDVDASSDDLIKVRAGSSVGISDYTNNTYFSFGSTKIGEITFTAISTTLWIRLYSNTSLNGIVKINSVIAAESKSEIINGNFLTDYGWTLGVDWSISGGLLTKATGSVQTEVTQGFTFTPGDKYRVIYTVTGMTGGNHTARVGGTNAVYTVATTNGVHVYDLVAGDTNQPYFSLIGSSLFDGSIDDVRLYKLELVNGTWQPVGNVIVNPSFDGFLDDTKWLYNGSSGEHPTVQGSVLTLYRDSGVVSVADVSFITQVGKLYKLSFDNIDSVSTRVVLGTGQASTSICNFNVSANAEISFKATSATTWLRLFNTGADGSNGIDNISVTPIQNLVENGELSSDRVWSKEDGWSISGGAANYVGGAGYNTRIFQENVMEVGKLYTISINVVSLVGTGSIGIDAISGSIVKGSGSISSAGTITCEIISENTDLLIYGVDSLTSATIDNIELYELDVQDLTGSGNNGRVVGQLEKSVVNTGCDLTAWSGFGAIDYIEIPHSDNFNFGTGDFHIAYWFNQPSAVSSKWVINKRLGSVDGFMATHSLNFILKTAATSFDSGILPTYDKPTLVVWNRASSGLTSLYLNGIKVYETTQTAQDIDTTQPLWVGIDNSKTYPFNGSLDFIKVGSGILSAEQIKFIYDTERNLFQPNSIGAISSGGVIDHDSITNTLVTVNSSAEVKFINGCNIQDSGFQYVNYEANIAYPVSLPVKGIAMLDGKVINALSNMAFMWTPEIILKDMLAELADAGPMDAAIYSSVGSGQTSVAVPYGFNVEMVWDDSVPVPWSIKSDGFIDYAVISASAGDVKLLIRRK